MSVQGSWGEEDIRRMARMERSADRSLRGLYFAAGFGFGMVLASILLGFLHLP